MLMTHVRAIDRPEHLPVLETHLDLVRDAVDSANLHPRDRERLLAMVRDESDPADHTDHLVDRGRRHTPD